MAKAKERCSVYGLSTSQVLERYRNTSAKDLFVRDRHLRGFGLRITPSNTKSFFVESREGATGKVRRIVLGRYPVLTLNDAHKRALEALRSLRYGEHSSRPQNINLRTVVECFLEAKKPVLRSRSLDDYRTVFYSLPRARKQATELGCFSQWMDCPVTTISR